MILGKILSRRLDALWGAFVSFGRATDLALCNLKLIRRLNGWHWFKKNGQWFQPDRITPSGDGTVYLTIGNTSFHQTHLSVEAFEVYE